MPYLIAIVAFALIGGTYSLFLNKSDDETNLVDTATRPIEVAIEEQPTPENTTATTRKFSGEFEYLVPRGITHSLQISLTLEGDIIVAADIGHDEAGKGVTKNHINFDAAYEPFVIGANIKDISLSRVGGASMTSNAFNDIVEDIRTELENAI